MSKDKFKCILTGQEFENEEDCKKILLPDGQELVVRADLASGAKTLLVVAREAYSPIVEAAKSSEEFSEELVIPTPKELYAKMCERIVGQEIAKRKVAVAVHRHYTFITSEAEDKEWKKSNLLFIGDSGCGKTHISRVVSKMIHVPFVTGDCTQITEAGYVGDDAEVVLSSLLAEANDDVDMAQRGMIFLDEIDKIAKKSGGNPSLTRDVSGEGVQQALLKMVEGTTAHVQRVSDGKRKNPRAQTVPIDTSNILFIGAGVFPGLEDIISKRLNFNAKIGFRGSVNKKHLEMERTELLSMVTAQDLIEYGFISEFVGRFPVIIPFASLSKEDMLAILISIKGSYYEQAKWIFGENGINIKLTDEALDLIAEKAINDPRGARALQSLMEEFLMDIYFDNVGDLSGDLDISYETVANKINISKLD